MRKTVPVQRMHTERMELSRAIPESAIKSTENNQTIFLRIFILVEPSNDLCTCAMSPTKCEAERRDGAVAVECLHKAH